VKKPKQAKGLSKFHKQSNHDFEFAKRCLFKTGRMGQTFVLHTKKGLMCIPVGWDTETEKMVVLLQIRLLMIASNAEAVSFLTEAWASDRAREAVTPDEADRMDSVMALLYFRDDLDEWQTIVRCGEINRSASGKPLAVSLAYDTTQMEDSRHGGLFHRVLTAETDDTERALAGVYYRACNIQPGTKYAA
jgi:hypothetical protein